MEAATKMGEQGVVLRLPKSHLNSPIYHCQSVSHLSYASFDMNSVSNSDDDGLGPTLISPAQDTRDRV